MEYIFLIAFTLHNIEEAIWLPKWSQNNGTTYARLSKRSFYPALIMITSVGYAITLSSLIFGRFMLGFKYAFIGFVVMMGMNAIFPHLLLTVRQKRYMPGTITGLLLNLPVGVAIVLQSLKAGMNLCAIVLSGSVTIIVTTILLQRWMTRSSVAPKSIRR